MNLKKQFGYPAKRDPLSVGFTLIELLIVVLIIGILSAVAIPMYQGAVDKSNFSTMLAPTRSLKEAQEGVRMATGNYTDNAEDLDVTLSQDSLSYEFQTRDNGDEFNAIIATNPKLPNVRLARYLDENLLLAGQLHCQAKAGDERANRLCGPLLIGQELKDIDGYISYLLDEEIDQPTCDYAGKSYSTSKTKCYKDTATRCEALGMGIIAGQDQCGYTNTNKTTVVEDGKCIGTERDSCKYTTIENGGVCEGDAYGACSYSTINDGGTCVGSVPWVPCSYSTVNEGGVCIGKAQDGCGFSTINAGGTCIGAGGVNPGNFTCKNVILNGGKCIGNGGTRPCVSATVNEGSICEANVGGGCYQATINSGGACEANAQYSCAELTVNAGGKCVANFKNSCTGTYNGGCCEGEHCPNYAPKC